MMLVIKSVLGATGRVQAVDAAVSGAAYIAGQAYQSGKVVWTEDAVDPSDTYIGGYRHDTDGRLRIYDASAGLPTPTNTNSGVAMTEDGQVCVNTGANANVAVINSISLDNLGRVFADIS